MGDNKNTSYLNSFLKIIKNKNLGSHCKVLGHLNKEDLKMMYLCSNLVISAPLKPEGFGRVISESLAMKKIILAYNCGGASNQLEILDQIYKVKDQNIDELISKINMVLNFTEDYILNLGNIARKHVINNYSKHSMQNAYFNFYKGL